MTTVIITSGAHWRNVGVSHEADQYAHIFDPESAEDVPHEAWNFITYYNALGGCEGSVVLYRPDDEPQEWMHPIEAHSARHFGPEDDHIEVMMSDWVILVETALSKRVEVL
jgi:hypothetical protein